MSFGMMDPRLQPMAGRPAWQNPGPLAAPQLTPGFRPPGAGGGGLPGMMPQQQGMPGMPMMPFGMMQQKSGNNGMPEDAKLGQSVAAINALQSGADGQFAQPPMPTDIGSGGGGSWLGFMKGLFPKMGGA